MINEKSLLLSLLTDINGVSRIESEDPRWIQLLSTSHMLSLMNQNLASEYCDLLIVNNKITGNFVQLLEQTSSRVYQISSTKTNPNGQSIDQCCMALYLSNVLFQYLISCLTPAELRTQLFLPIDWPMNTVSSSALTAIIDGKIVLETLLDVLVAAIDQPKSSHWMHDIKFFSTNLLVTLASTQLYQLGDGNESASSSSVSNDMFLSHLYNRAEGQLRDALRGGHSVSEAFTSSLAVRLVRGLFVSGLLDLSDDLVAISDSAGGKKGIPHKSLLSLLQDAHTHSLRQNSTVVAKNSSTSLLTVPRLASSTERASGGGGYWDLITSPIQTIQKWWWEHVSLASSRSAPLLLQGPSSPSASGGGGVCGAAENVGRINLPADPLQERSLNLLLILLHNNRSSASRNPFREVFGMLQDESIGREGDDDAEGDLAVGGGREIELMSRGKGALMVSSLHVDFRRAIRGLESCLPSESASLLLYSLLQSHPTFADMLLATDTVHLLLDRCLHGLHSLTRNTTSAKPTGDSVLDSSCQSSARLNRMYILVICVLLMLQDGALMERIVAMRVQVSWYKERHLQNISLLDVVTLCVLRTVMFSVFRAKDAYLLGNCCAVLHNVSTRAVQLHPYTSERVVKMTFQLAGRIANGAVTDPVALQLLVSAFSALINFTSTALRPSSRLSNAHLLYALIHDFESVERNLCGEGLERVLLLAGGGDQSHKTLQILPRIVHLAREHLAAIERLRGGMDDVGRYFSADEAIASLRLSINAAESDGSASRLLDENVQLDSFCYLETDRPEDFFVPCVWTATIGSSPEVAWRLMDIALFNPFSTGFLTWRQEEEGQKRTESLSVETDMV